MIKRLLAATSFVALAVSQGFAAPPIAGGIPNPLPTTMGGTNARDAPTARTNLGATERGANSTVTSLLGLTTPLPLSEGGCAGTTADTCRANIIGAKSGVNSDISALTGLSYIYITNNTSSTETSDHGTVTVTNDPTVTAQDVLNISTPTESISDAYRAIVVSRPGNAILGIEGFAVYGLNYAPYNNAPDAGAIRDNWVGFFTVVHDMVDGAYAWTINGACSNRIDYAGTGVAGTCNGAEWDFGNFSPNGIMNGEGFLLTGSQQPLNAQAIAIDAFGPIDLTLGHFKSQWTVGINISAGSILNAGDGIILASKLAFPFIANNVGSSSIDMVFGTYDQDTELDVATAPYAIVDNGGSGCASGTFSLSGGAGTQAQVTLTAAGGVITAATNASDNGLYSVTPNGALNSGPTTVAVAGTSCAHPPTITVDFIPNPHYVQMFAFGSAGNSALRMVDKFGGGGFDFLMSGGNPAIYADGPSASTNLVFIPKGQGGKVIVQSGMTVGADLTGPLLFAGGTYGFRTQAHTYTDTSGSGTISQIEQNEFDPVTYASTNAMTLQNAATLYITGAPIAGTNVTITNAWGLQVGAAVKMTALNISAIAGSAGSGGLYVCVDTTGQTYKKASCP